MVKCKLKINDDVNNWLLLYGEYTTIAFNITDNKVNKLAKEESIVHAFLPTEDTNGLSRSPYTKHIPQLNLLAN